MVYIFIIQAQVGPRFNPYLRKSTPIQWGVSNGTHVRHDTRLPRTFEPPGPEVRETAPEHAPASSSTAGHASGRSTPGTSSGSSGRSSRQLPTPVGGPSSEHDLSRSRRTGAPQSQNKPFSRQSCTASTSHRPCPSLSETLDALLSWDWGFPRRRAPSR